MIMRPVDNGTMAALRAGLATEAGRLAAAIGLASPVWDDPCLAPEDPARNPFGDQAPRWTPRYACYHALCAHWQVIEYANEVIGRYRRGEPPASRNELLIAWLAREPERLPLWDGLRDAPGAVTTAQTLFLRVGDIAAEFDDAALDVPADVGDFNAAYVRSFGETDTPETVRTWLAQAVLHLHDHADQIRSAGG